VSTRGRELKNAEIAQALFVSLKTVETRLHSAYRKLDISSRRELPQTLSATN
jgi:DNA-binding NarL/FixJ family response regulator